MYFRMPQDDPEKAEEVFKYMKSRMVPLSVKNISKNTGMTKRQILSICHKHEEITRVNPEYYGSGRFKGSVFISSTDPKYSFVKRFVDI